MKLFGTFPIGYNVAVILRFVLGALAVLIPFIAFWAFDAQGLWVLVPEVLLVVFADLHRGLKK